MRSLFRHRALRRGAAVFSLALVASAAVAARPAAPTAPGLSYRMRMVMTMPEIPGMPPQSPTVIVGHGVAIGSQTRLEIDSITGQLPIAVGDVMLTLDSGRTVLVSPSAKTYSEDLSALLPVPKELLAQAVVSNVNVTTEKLGAGEAMQGHPTEKVRMTITYAMSAMGMGINSMTTMEMWMAKLPASIGTPFDGTLPKEMSEGPMKELAEKTAAARKALGTVTPLKTVTTATATLQGMNLTTTTTIEMLDVKAGEVDPAMLKVPEGYTKK